MSAAISFRKRNCIMRICSRGVRIAISSMCCWSSEQRSESLLNLTHWLFQYRHREGENPSPWLYWCIKGMWPFVGTFGSVVWLLSRWTQQCSNYLSGSMLHFCGDLRSPLLVLSRFWYIFFSVFLHFFWTGCICDTRCVAPCWFYLDIYSLPVAEQMLCCFENIFGTIVLKIYAVFLWNRSLQTISAGWI